ncbi:hypothetical protein [Chitiniphilus eburneus]|uniref:Uncharacterized protein n=1 Tax=Chitiniphilus eburneus TaxID=2571148 RepID=A0A4U0PV58_9NEIS|nr:hypothetical protein [Chitiniphilus eburneus]TJZ72020.1 hypothetical protein FAZ21_12885 [Chitiniphilus eburneus]
MSLVHMYLNKLHESKEIVCYEVVTADATGSLEWSKEAELTIFKNEKRYEFELLNAWKNENFIPPQLYLLPESDLDALLEGEYSEFRWGAWSSRINRWASFMMHNQEYPQVAPSKNWINRMAD